MPIFGLCNKNPLVDENDVCHPMQILKYIVSNLYFPYVQGSFIAILVTTSMVSGPSGGSQKRPVPMDDHQLFMPIPSHVIHAM